MKLLLSCGPGLENKETSHLLVVDWQNKDIIDVHECRHKVITSSHKGFTGGNVVDDQLVIANEVEIFKYQLLPLKLIDRYSHHFFNDLHYVTFIDDFYYVCNTGLDTIEIFDKHFKHQETITLIDKFGYHLSHLFQLFKDNFYRWSKKNIKKLGYYEHLQDNIWGKNIRKLLDPLCFHKSKRDLRFQDLRPHLLHPNHIFSYEGEIWVTLWRGGGVLGLNDGKFLVKESGWPHDALHDGVMNHQDFFLTDAQNNRLLVYTKENEPLKFRNVSRLFVTEKKEQGFLRGIAVSSSSVFLGLSARRNSSHWSFARIIEFDRKSLKKIDEWNIPEKYGKMIYSVLDVSHIY